ncbi:hypothetical protein ACE939_03665 [Aquimarina sp. W85]|uniref:hypothetical protein n=1 Tax=Aquimarina rhodophyticola TaxID=3342246 RepID=UPI00366FA1FB
MINKLGMSKNRISILSQIVLDSEQLIEKIDALICSAHTPDNVYTDLTKERTLLAIETMKIKSRLLTDSRVST